MIASPVCPSGILLEVAVTFRGLYIFDYEFMACLSMIKVKTTVVIDLTENF